MRLIEPMEHEAAIRVLEMAVTYNGCGRATSDDLVEALKMAKEALKKLVPKKPREVEDHAYFGTNCYDHSTARCPNCQYEFVFDECYQPKYCEHCGQALDWEEGEADGNS